MHPRVHHSLPCLHDRRIRRMLHRTYMWYCRAVAYWQHRIANYHRLKPMGRHPLRLSLPHHRAVWRPHWRPGVHWLSELTRLGWRWVHWLGVRPQREMSVISRRMSWILAYAPLVAGQVARCWDQDAVSWSLDGTAAQVASMHAHGGHWCRNTLRRASTYLLLRCHGRQILARHPELPLQLCEGQRWNLVELRGQRLRCRRRAGRPGHAGYLTMCQQLTLLHAWRCWIAWRSSEECVMLLLKCLLSTRRTVGRDGPHLSRWRAIVSNAYHQVAWL